MPNSYDTPATCPMDAQTARETLAEVAAEIWSAQKLRAEGKRASVFGLAPHA